MCQIASVHVKCVNVPYISRIFLTYNHKHCALDMSHRCSKLAPIAIFLFEGKERQYCQPRLLFLPSNSVVTHTSTHSCVSTGVSCVCPSGLVCQPSLIFVHFLSLVPMVPTVHVVLSPACQISKTKLANAQLARALHLNVQNPYFLTFLLRLYISFIFQVCEDY